MGLLRFLAVFLSNRLGEGALALSVFVLTATCEYTIVSRSLTLKNRTRGSRAYVALKVSLFQSRSD